MTFKVALTSFSSSSKTVRWLRCQSIHHLRIRSRRRPSWLSRLAQKPRKQGSPLAFTMKLYLWRWQDQFLRIFSTHAKRSFYPFWATLSTKLIYPTLLARIWWRSSTLSSPILTWPSVRSRAALCYPFLNLMWPTVNALPAKTRPTFLKPPLSTGKNK